MTLEERIAYDIEMIAQANAKRAAILAELEKPVEPFPAIDFARMTFPQATEIAPLLGRYYQGSAKLSRYVVALDDAFKAGMQEATK